MAEYAYTIAAVDVGQLHDEAIAAGIPVEAIRGTDTGARVFTVRDLTAREQDTLAALATAHVPLTDLKKLRAEAVKTLTGEKVSDIRARAEAIQMLKYIKQLVDAHNSLLARLVANSRITQAQANPLILPVPTRVNAKAEVVSLINADNPNN